MTVRQQGARRLVRPAGTAGLVVWSNDPDTPDIHLPVTTPVSCVARAYLPIIFRRQPGPGLRRGNRAGQRREPPALFCATRSGPREAGRYELPTGTGRPWRADS